MRSVKILLLKLLCFIAYIIEFAIDINDIDTVSWPEYPVTVKVKVIMPPLKSDHLKVIDDPCVSVVLSYTLKLNHGSIYVQGHSDIPQDH